MEPITPPITSPRPESIGLGAKVHMTKGPLPVVMQNQLVQKNSINLPTGFIRNVSPAFPTQAKVIDAEAAKVFVLFLNTNSLQLNESQWLEKRKKWKNAEYRHAYMEAALEQGVAWQIKINRESRKLSQAQLARCIGSRQSAISRAEDPSYGRHRLETLVKVANAFDCALQVKFVPYSQLAKDSDDLSPEALYAKSYLEETGQ